jgi:hypothetical protein
MKSVNKFTVSYFESKNKFPSVTQKKGIEKSLLNILIDIKQGVFSNQIENIRSLPPKEANEQKKFLPAFTPSGRFTERKEAAIISHSHLLCLDFDDLDNAIDIRDCLSLDNWVFAAFVSPLGKGVKALIKIEADKHKESFTSLANHYEKELGIRVDESGKDVSRLCFVSHDEELYSNEKANTFLVDNKEENNKDKTQLIFEIDTIVKRIEQKQIDITQGYKEWLRLGFALAASIGETGRSYFHRLSKFSTQYEFTQCDTQFSECLKERKGGISIHSLFWMAKNNGIDIKIESSPSPSNTTIKSNTSLSFKNSNGEEITDRERIENSISEIFEIRKNIILDRVECKEKDKENSKWEPANEDDISRELELKRVKNCSPNRIKSIINSKFVKPFNPFKYYFENLPAYNKKSEPDYIQQLADIVQLKDEIVDRERFNKHFKKALVRCVACSLSDEVNNLYYNKHAIIFISPKQSIGKSGFIRFLMPKELELYCVEKMSFGNRDEQFTMQSSFIINLDEMASIEERNLQSVKSAMSTGVINVRKINSGQRIIEPRRCNFFGNTNETHILKDDTGSVRWLCFEVDGFNKETEYWERHSSSFVDINNVWSMAYSLFKDGFKFQLTNEELQQNEIVNDQYKEVSIEEQVLKNHFKPAEKLKEYHKQTIDILNSISFKYPSLSNKLNLTKLGTALKNNGFYYGQEYDRLKGFQIKGYYVMEL